MDTNPRRRSKRIPSQLAVHWIRRGAPVPAVAADINEHGLFIRTDLEAQPGELLQLVIQLEDGPLQVCVIARFIGLSASGRGVGAELFVMSEGDRRRWSRHYRTCLRLGDRGAVPSDTMESYL